MVDHKYVPNFEQVGSLSDQDPEDSHINIVVLVSDVPLILYPGLHVYVAVASNFVSGSTLISPSDRSGSAPQSGNNSKD